MIWNDLIDHGRIGWPKTLGNILHLLASEKGC